MAEANAESGLCEGNRLSQVVTLELENRGRLLAMSDSAQEKLSSPGESLRPVEGSLLRHYFQLERAERRLAVEARRRRPAAGFAAIRQIERERTRLGRELHTGVGQMLAAIRLQIEVLLAQLPGAPAAVQQAAQRIATLAADALEQVRSISRRLHPPEWQRLTLEEAIRQLWELSGIPQRFGGSLRVEPLPRQPRLEVTAAFYRAAQEAFSNIAQHSRATRVDAVLEERDGRVVLEVSDNGVGFDAAALGAAHPRVGSGLGLRSIRELAAAAGAEFRVESGPGGTKIVVSAPIEPGSGAGG